MVVVMSVRDGVYFFIVSASSIAECNSAVTVSSSSSSSVSFLVV